MKPLKKLSFGLDFVSNDTVIDQIFNKKAFENIKFIALNISNATLALISLVNEFPTLNHLSIDVESHTQRRQITKSFKSLLKE